MRWYRKCPSFKHGPFLIRICILIKTDSILSYGDWQVLNLKMLPLLSLYIKYLYNSFIIASLLYISWDLFVQNNNKSVNCREVICLLLNGLKRFINCSAVLYQKIIMIVYLLFWGTRFLAFYCVGIIIKHNALEEPGSDIFLSWSNLK